MKPVIQAEIDASRLWRRLMEMAEIGASEKGGVNRQAFSDADHDACALLASWAAEVGFAVATDPIGNLFVYRDGRNREAPPVLLGSHLDSQPTGGKFDGALGVVAAFETLHALEQSQLETERSVVCVAWRNEEGSRFQPSCMGSRLFAGQFDLESCLQSTDTAGTSVAGALARSRLDAAQIPLGFPIAGYLELHIEQGPELERLGTPVGAVTGIQGRRRYRVKVTGAEAHAGTTPRELRKDALISAARIIDRLDSEIQTVDSQIRFTVGALDVYPNSPNTIPGTVRFIIDLRHPEEPVLEETGERIAALCQIHRGPCGVAVSEISAAPPTLFPENMIDRVAQSAEVLGLSPVRLASGAGHDAAACAALAPTGMIFIPCRDGLSHTEEEWADPSDVEAGTRVLAQCAAELASGRIP